MATYEKLSSMDRVFLDLESPNSHMHVAATMVLESAPLSNDAGGVDIDKVRAYIGSRLHLMPRYRQKLRFTPFDKQPIWVDDDRFRIEYHVRHTCLRRVRGSTRRGPWRHPDRGGHGGRITSNQWREFVYHS